MIAAAGTNLTFSDIPGDASIPSVAPPTPGGSSTSSGSGTTSQAASTPGTCLISWYVALTMPGFDPVTIFNPTATPLPFPFFAVRTAALAVPSDAAIAAYDAELSSRRQIEYLARLADLQQTIAAAQAALADGATFDVGQEIFRQILGKILTTPIPGMDPKDPDRKSPPNRTCAYLEAWRDAFAWDYLSYVMTPCWMNPTVDFYNPPPPPGGGPLDPEPLAQLLEVFSGLQSQVGASGSASFPYREHSWSASL